MELDHIFIATTKGAPEAEALIRAGFVEGSANTHPGQGTANRRFFFDNFFIELLWLSEPHEAMSSPASLLQLDRRLASPSNNVSPFGICLRPGANDELRAPGFRCVDYLPPYLPSGMRIQVAESSPLREPLWFYLDFAVPPRMLKGTRSQPLQEGMGVSCLTGLSVISPEEAVSIASSALSVDGLVDFLRGTAHCVELEFDHHTQGNSVDLRPVLPILIHY